jgi:hypothetical protein
VVQEWDRQQQVQAQRRKRKRRRMTIHQDLGMWGVPRRVERKMNHMVSIVICCGILATDSIEHIPSSEAGSCSVRQGMKAKDSGPCGSRHLLNVMCVWFHHAISIF